MFSLKNKLSNVQSVKADGINLFYAINNTVYKNDTAILNDVEPQFFQSIDNVIFYSNLDGDCFYHEELRNNQSVDFTPQSFSYSDGKIVGLYGFIIKDGRPSWKIGYFDIEKKVMIFEITDFENFTCSIFQDKILIGVKEKKIISCFNLSNKTRLWDFNLSTAINKDICESEVYCMIGIWQNELLIGTKNGVLLSLDLINGSVLHSWKNINDLHDNIIPTDRFVLDTKNSFLIGLSFRSCVEIDLKTQEVKEFYLKEELDKFKITTLTGYFNNPFTDTHFYLTASLEQENNTQWTVDCLLALNRQTKKVDWFFKFEGTSLSNNKPILIDNRLYQLDNKGILYIFE